MNNLTKVLASSLIAVAASSTFANTEVEQEVVSQEQVAAVEPTVTAETPDSAVAASEVAAE